MRGDSRDLTKLAAFAAAPLLGERRHNDFRQLIKPPTWLMLLIDPDAKYETPKAVERERQKIVDEIELVVRTQGADPDRGELEDLVRIHTWDASCFEFAHFTDAELARALHRTHRDCGGLDAQKLRRALAHHRKHREDIKKVWANWRPSVSKLDLAEQLWPMLEGKITAAMNDPDGELPPVASRLAEAYALARSRPNGTFVMRDRSTSNGQ